MGPHSKSLYSFQEYEAQGEFYCPPPPNIPHPHQDGMLHVNQWAPTAKAYIYSRSMKP